MIKQELLQILCCPACKENLDFDRENNTLTCKQCRRKYPINNDIPRLFVNESVERTEYAE